MTNEEFLKEFNSLPADIKGQIEGIIERFKRDRASETKPKKKIPLSEEPFCGMWADREDMKDPVEWVRNIRRTHWDRSHRWTK